MIYVSQSYTSITEAFIKENTGVLSRYDRSLEKRRLLRINIAMAAAAMTIIAQCPPKCIRNTRMPAPMNAQVMA